MDYPIKTTIQGIDWPALPATAGACRLAAVFQMEQSQWWPEEKIRKHQFKQVDALLRHAVKHVPYYRNMLGKKMQKTMISEQQWLDIPLLTRDKLQQAGNSLHTDVLPPSHGRVKMQRTSGSTGKPVEALTTDITGFFWNVFTIRDHVWHKRDFGCKLAVIRHIPNKKAKPPHGMRSQNWGSSTDGLIETGSCVAINIHTPLSEQAAWLQREDPDYLLTHPSILQELALHCQREGIQLPSLREVRTLSEAQPDGLRELCRSVWGVELVDVYSSIELGYLALQCPDHEHYHMQSEGVFLEVLDDDGKPCLPGQIGKVVATSLHNFAMPLIRYELGDFAEVGEPCSCGRGLPVIKRILGRYRNLITLPDGERCWPKFGMADILKVAPVLQFQAIQHTIQEVEFLLVMESPLNDDDKQKLVEMFKSNLHPDMDISVREVYEIARSASGKYEDFMSKL